MAIKLDLGKAYDRSVWTFMQKCFTEISKGTIERQQKEAIDIL